MGSYVRLVVTLTAIAAAASFGLSAVYNATHEITEEYKRLEQASARVAALGCSPDAFFEETVTDSILDGRQFAYQTAYEDESRADVLGYAFVAYGKGYSSTIETIVGVVDGSICGIKIVDQKETPGLGAKVQEVSSANTLWAVISGSAVDETGKRPWFEVQYDGLTQDDLRVVKTPGEPGILAVTGATISSEAVTGSVRSGLAMLMSIVGTDEEAGAETGAGAGAETGDGAGLETAGEEPGADAAVTEAGGEEPGADAAVTEAGGEG